MNYEKNWKYRNRQDETFYLGRELTAKRDNLRSRVTIIYSVRTRMQKLVVHPGYTWNGLSWVPDFFDSERNMRASLAHDALYDLIRRGAIPYKQKKYADRVFRRVLKEDGTNIVMRSLMYFFVRWFAGFACKPKGA